MTHRTNVTQQEAYRQVQGLLDELYTVSEDLLGTFNPQEVSDRIRTIRENLVAASTVLEPEHVDS